MLEPTKGLGASFLVRQSHLPFQWPESVLGDWVRMAKEGWINMGGNLPHAALEGSQLSEYTWGKRTSQNRSTWH